MGTVVVDRVVEPKKEDWSALFARMDEASRSASFLEQLQKVDAKTASSSSSSVGPSLGSVGFAKAVDTTLPCFDTNSADADSFVPNKQRHLTLETQEPEDLRNVFVTPPAK